MCSWTGPVDMVRREGGVRRAPPSFCPSSRNGIAGSTAVLVVFLRWPVPSEAVRAEELWRSKRLTKQCVGARELFVPALARKLGVVMVGRLVFFQFYRLRTLF